MTVSENELLTTLKSFTTGSAPGIDGLRPQLLKDLVSVTADDSGYNLLKSLTNLCNFLLSGRLHHAIYPYFFGASLIGINKKVGGVRPIAIGNTFRRLVSKLICNAVKDECSAYLQPSQQGFGTPLGSEIIIHSMRSFLNRNANSNKILLKLDFRNAFNCIERDVMLQAIKQQFPKIFSYLWQCYGYPSNYFSALILFHLRPAANRETPLAHYFSVLPCNLSSNSYLVN